MVIICGCSWSTRDENHPNIEFGHLISEELGMDYINLAKDACTNFGIRLQIDYALKKYNPSLIIINATSPVRTELSIDKQRYKLDDGWENFIGNKPTSLVESYHGVFNYDLKHNFSVNELKNKLENVFDEHTHDIYKDWFVHFYNVDIEMHKQFYILQSGIYKLINSGVPFLFSPNTFDFAEGVEMLGDDNIIQRNKFEWDIPTENFQIDGIAETLQHCIKIYGSWENSPGPKYSHHLPPESHKEYFKRTINQIKRIL